MLDSFNIHNRAAIIPTNGKFQFVPKSFSAVNDVFNFQSMECYGF